MRFTEFFERVESEGLEIQFDRDTAAKPIRLSNEALFHLPLIAITVLMISRGRHKPRVDELGQLVGECFERTFSGFRGSAQHLGWSAALRVRTVQALAFLEETGLVVVDEFRVLVSITPAGKRVLSRALSAAGDLAHNLVLVERSYRNIRSDRQFKLEPT